MCIQNYPTSLTELIPISLVSYILLIKVCWFTKRLIFYFRHPSDSEETTTPAEHLKDLGFIIKPNDSLK